MRRNTHTTHRTRRAIVMLMLMAMTFTAKAQVFMLDGDENYREPEDPAVFADLPENFGMGVDWYAPVGDGLMLLSALGGAYLISKRRKSVS